MNLQGPGRPDPGPRWLGDDEQAVWRAWLAAVRTVEEALDRQLQQAAGMPHTYYQVLAMLSEAPERRRRMKDLADVLGASQSRTSHAVARLEEAGWVARSPDPTDRRGTVATLTDQGLAVLEGAAPGHVDAVRRVLFDVLSPEQVHALGAACRRVVEGADSHQGPGSLMLPR